MKTLRQLLLEEKKPDGKVLAKSVKELATRICDVDTNPQLRLPSTISVLHAYFRGERGLSESVRNAARQLVQSDLEPWQEAQEEWLRKFDRFAVRPYPGISDQDTQDYDALCAAEWVAQEIIKVIPPYFSRLFGVPNVSNVILFERMGLRKEDYGTVDEKGLSDAPSYTFVVGSNSQASYMLHEFFLLACGLKHGVSPDFKRILDPAMAYERLYELFQTSRLRIIIVAPELCFASIWCYDPDSSAPANYRARKNEVEVKNVAFNLGMSTRTVVSRLSSTVLSSWLETFYVKLQNKTLPGYTEYQDWARDLMAYKEVCHWEWKAQGRIVNGE